MKYDLGNNIHHNDCEVIMERLKTKSKDDSVLYSIMFPGRVVHLFYFVEENQFGGAPSILSFDSVPAEIFEGKYLFQITILPVNAHLRDNQKESFGFNDVYVTLPFAKQPNLEAPVVGPQKRIHNFVYHKFPEFYDSRRQKFFDKEEKVLKQRHLHTRLEREDNAFNPMAHLNGKNTDILNTIKKLNPGRRPVAVIGMYWLDTGGAEICALEALEAAHKAGYLTICITDRRGKETFYPRAKRSADYVFELASSLPHYKWRQFYGSLFCLFDVKIIHIHHCNSMYSHLPLMKTISPKTKVISSTHIIEFRDGGFCRTSGVFSNYIDVQHVISRELLSYYAEEFQLGPDKTALSYLIKDNENSDISCVHTREVLRNKCSLLFVGRMCQQKRPYLIASIAKKLVKEKIDFSITMVGGGNMLDLTKMHAKKLKVDHLIEFKGNLDSDEVKKEMKRHHILLLPSQNEGLALVCYEATLEGVVVVSTDVGSQSELVARELLVSRHTYSCIKETVTAIKRLVHERGFYKRMFSEQAEKFNKIAGSKKYDQFLKEVYNEQAVG